MSFSSPKDSLLSVIICQVETLQREVSARNSHWQQQRQREGDLLSDLDSAVFQFVFREANSSQVRSDRLMFFMSSVV